VNLGFFTEDQLSNYFRAMLFCPTADAPILASSLNNLLLSRMQTIYLISRGFYEPLTAGEVSHDCN
jgi:hypothetical protein